MNFNTSEENAQAFAIHWHGDQKRKYTVEPYWLHPRNVARLVKQATSDPEVIAAAWLHDVIEDTECTEDVIQREFGPNVARWVVGLSDHYTRERYRQLNRETRKELEARRLGNESSQVKLVKIADLIDNSVSIDQYDPAFAPVYMREKRRLLDHLTGVSDVLWDQAYALVAGVPWPE